jgi:hypothetical protein
MRRTIIALCVCTAVFTASIALAGKKPPTTAPFVPDIGYTYSSGNYTDVRLANRAGTQAILVHRTNFAAIGGFDLSRDDSRRIAYVDHSQIYVRTWSDAGGSVSISPATAVYLGPGLAHGVDFSPDGSQLAFGVGGQTDVGLYIASLPGGTPQRVLDGYEAFDPRWDPSGNFIYFWGAPVSGTGPTIYKYDVAADTVAPLIPLAPGQLINFDVTRPSGDPSSARLIVDHRDSNDQPMVLRLWTTDGQLVGSVTEGTKAHFNCSNSAVIHHDWAIRRVPVAITNVDGTGQTIWSSDSNIHRTDWMPRAICA